MRKADNKKEFIQSQDSYYPNLNDYQYKSNNLGQVKLDIASLETELEEMLVTQNNIAKWKSKLSETELQQKHFDLYFKETHSENVKIKNISKTNSAQIMKLWLQCEAFGEQAKELTFWFKLKSVFLYGISDFSFYEKPIEKIIPAFRSLYYTIKVNELKKSIAEAESKLRRYNFKEMAMMLTRKQKNLCSMNMKHKR